MTRLDYQLKYDEGSRKYFPSDVKLDGRDFDLNDPSSNELVVELVMQRIRPSLEDANLRSIKNSPLEFHDSVWLT